MFVLTITLSDCIFPQMPRSSGFGGGLGFFIRSSYKSHKIESLFYQSIGFHGHSLLLACVYRPPGSYTCNFQEECMNFFGFLSSIYSLYYICGDFNIPVDVPVGDGPLSSPQLMLYLAFMSNVYMI